MSLKFITRLAHKLPKYINDIWYNKSAYMSEEKYPVIFDSDKNYIDCELGVKVIMGKTKDGKSIYYEVIKKWRTSGGDWLASSDAINCNLKFSHIGNH